MLQYTYIKNELKSGNWWCNHCASIPTHYSKGCLYRCICGCGFIRCNCFQTSNEKSIRIVWSLVT